MNNRKFIKNFRKIKLKKICKNVNVNYSNILNEKASERCFDKVRNELDKEILLLYRSDYNE